MLSFFCSIDNRYKLANSSIFLSRGSFFSALAGYFGMKVATKANVRTANAAKEEGMNKALNIAFSGGSVMGG